MNMINKNTKTDKVLSLATERLANDVANMSVKRNSAIDVFNSTVKNLEAINKDLKSSAERYRAFARVALDKAEEADSIVADNEVVCNKIYEIIGKPPVSAAADEAA